MRRDRTKILFLTTVFALLLLYCPLEASDFTVELPSSIEAREGEFYLGEYALFEGDAEVADSASMAVIRPDGGSFGRQDVIEALGTTKAAGSAVVLRMPERVRVLPESPIASELRKMVAWKWRIDVEGISADRLGNFSLPPRVMPGARSIAVKRIDEKGHKTNKQVKIKWFQPVVYATRNLSRGAAIDQSDLRLRIDRIGMIGSCVWDPAQLKHATLRQAIGAGKAIATADVEQELVVKSGSTVTLIAFVNGLGVEARGMALQRGAIGDTIKVRNLSSKKVLSGKIVDVGRVEIR